MVRKVAKTYIHIVWSPQLGPMAAYTNPELAFTHARTMLGVDVGSLAVSDRLPDTLHEDLSEEFEGNDETPVEKQEDDMAIEIAVEVKFAELDDQTPKAR
jgi:hypothetical protein